MRFGDKIRKILGGEQAGDGTDRQPDIRTKEPYLTVAPGSDEIINVGSIEKINSCTHRDGTKTDIMMVRLVQQPEDWAIMPDSMDYVTFEIPKGTELTDKIIQEVMKQYSAERIPDASGEHYYLGRLIEEENGTVSFGNKSESVEKMAKKVVKEREDANRIQDLETVTAHNSAKRFGKEIDARSYVEEQEVRRRTRKKNPTLEKVIIPQYQMQGTKKSYSYDGVNVVNGQVLRIRGLNHIGKDGSGTHLYSGYIYNTENEDDADLSIEWIAQMNGAARVCFELPKSLLDIEKEGNLDEIKQVLQLLSDKRNFGEADKLKYIGGIDNDWQITRNEKSSSPAIQRIIQKIIADSNRGDAESAIIK